MPPAASTGTSLGFFDDLRQQIVERSRALDVAGGLDALANEIGGAGIEGAARILGAADLHAEPGAGLPDPRDHLRRGNAKRELDDRRAGLERDVERRRLEWQQVIERERPVGGGPDARDPVRMLSAVAVVPLPSDPRPPALDTAIVSGGCAALALVASAFSGHSPEGVACDVVLRCANAQRCAHSSRTFSDWCVDGLPCRSFDAPTSSLRLAVGLLRTFDLCRWPAMSEPSACRRQAEGESNGTATGIRTPVSRLRIWRPDP